tara:strand:+ start:2639 stop:3277 length:639 start_codon:yes stop_codon:yes gene_type:complete
VELLILLERHKIMDYKKRDQIRNEIDVLINRIITLQEQEKKYKNYTKDLVLIETELEAKNRMNKDLIQKINDSKNTLNNINESIIDKESKLKLCEFDIKKLTDKQKTIASHIDNLEKKLCEYEDKIKNKKIECDSKIRKLNYEYKSIIENKKKEITDLKNEKNIVEQEIAINIKQKEKEKNNIKQYKKSIKEIELEYSKHTRIKAEKDEIIR